MLSNLKGFFRPKSIPEALALLEKNSGSILVIAGGTKLVKSPNSIVQELVDIGSLGLGYIKEESGGIRLGATVTLQKLVESPTVNEVLNGVLSKAARMSNRSRMVRNMATLGGALVTAGPLSVLYCALLIMQAQIRIAGGEEFALPINIFLNKKGLGGGLLVETLIPVFKEATTAALVPIATENTDAVACAGARVTLTKGLCREVKIAITGCERVPRRIHEAELALEGKPLTSPNIEAAAETAHQVYRPISGPLASEEYRKEVCRSIVKKALVQCLENAENRL